MDQQRFAAVDQYLDGLFAPPDPELAAALARSSAAGLPEIAVSPGQGKLLQVLALTCGARRILEIGTLGGYSTTWLARALPAGGRLISLEFSPGHAAVARENLAAAGLAEIAEVRVGPAADSLAALIAEGAPPFDMVFIDADKPGYPAYLRLVMELVRPGSLIIADNVVRDGAVAEDRDDPTIQAVRRFLADLAAEPRLNAAAVQTVGSKGYDGFAIAVVRR